jgi:stage V sporulation protein G
MPSRKLTDHCPKCGGKNHLRSKFCNDCGAKLLEKRVSDEDAQGKLHADIAHPINSECRGRLQDVILQAYREELCHAGRAEEAEHVVGQTDAEGGESPPPRTPPADDDKPKGPRFGEGVV